MAKKIEKVLVVNCGSSSLKFQLFDMRGEQMLCKGLVERIGIAGSRLVYTKTGCEKIEDVLFADCDFLFPCARDGVINKDTAGKVKAKFIVEGANGPVTPEGDKILDGAGVRLVPDFLANSGGVIGSYFEWAQNLQGFFWTEEEYNNRLIHIMKENFNRVWDYAEAKKVKMRRAATMAAIQRVADVVEMRGLFL